MNGQPAPSIGWLDFGTPRDFLSPQFALIPYVLFCFVAGFTAIAVLYLDKSLVDSNQQSVLRVTYEKPLWKMSLTWFRGAFIAALIGEALQIWKPSLYAAVVVGLTWQFLLAQFQEIARHYREPFQPDLPDPAESRDE